MELWMLNSETVLPKGLCLINDHSILYGVEGDKKIVVDHYSFVPVEPMSDDTFLRVCTFYSIALYPIYLISFIAIAGITKESFPSSYF
jgi:hypothetical protein